MLHIHEGRITIGDAMLNHERTRLTLDVISTLALVIAASTLTFMTIHRQLPIAADAPPTGASAVESIDVTVAGTGHVKGAGTARLAILEFSDFQCPYCADFASKTLPQLEREFITPGTIQLIFRHNPLEMIHPFAAAASAAAECAGQQSKYWEMHDALFSRQRELATELFPAQAKELRLDIDAFTSCLGSTAVARRIKDDQQEAARLGLTSTPIFLVGRSESNGQIRFKKRINGAVPYEVFKQTIRELL
jgi:protein-disulfide isomerase